MEIVPYFEHQIRRWQVGNSTFLAWPEAGARLMHWSITRADQTVREVIHWPELTTWDQPIAKIRGGNPILFPFSARTFDQGDIHFWRDPQGQRRPMPMHGFARQGKFTLERIDANGFKAVLEPTPEDRDAYPFDYEFSVTYRFAASSLACEFALKNFGHTPIPWSAGHHFYFTIPWTDNHTRADYVLQRPDTQTVRQNEVGALVPGPKLPAKTPLSHPALVDAIHTNLANRRFRFGPADGSEHVDVMIGENAKPDAGQAIVTWTADESVPYYCVEPWMGPPNAPEHLRGLKWVPAGETGHFTVEVAVG